MDNKPNVYKDLERLSALSPIPVYWTNDTGVILGVNEHCFNLAHNLLNKALVGKSAHDIYTPETAVIVQDHISQVIKSAKTMSFEEELIDLITLEKRCYISTRSPLFEKNKVVGIIGYIIEITTQKEAEQLRLENIKLESQNKLNQIFLEKLAAEAVAEQLRLEKEAYLAQKKTQSKFLTFVDKLQRDIQSYKIEALSEQIGIKPKISNSDKQIRLTKRELDILYYLSLNKSPKDIAQIITIIENRSVSDSTVNAIINKKLYPKFEVFNIGQLIEKAILLNQIPFLLDNSGS